MWDLNFRTWVSHRGFTVAFGHGHPLVHINYIMGALTTFLGFFKGAILIGPSAFPQLQNGNKCAPPNDTFTVYIHGS
jgi:metallophosphoesterase superfamily enzyme